MIANLPNLLRFNQGYWHQMGQPVYGSIEAAFHTFLDDAERLPDNGVRFKTSLKLELKAAQASEYADWFNRFSNDKETIELVQGRFISPDEIAVLLRILEERLT